MFNSHDQTFHGFGLLNLSLFADKHESLQLASLGTVKRPSTSYHVTEISKTNAVVHELSRASHVKVSDERHRLVELFDRSPLHHRKPYSISQWSLSCPLHIRMGLLLSRPPR
jgi:hypothetical protein